MTGSPIRRDLSPQACGFQRTQRKSCDPYQYNNRTPSTDFKSLDETIVFLVSIFEQLKSSKLRMVLVVLLLGFIRLYFFLLFLLSRHGGDVDDDDDDIDNSFVVYCIDDGVEWCTPTDDDDGDDSKDVSSIFMSSSAL
uniref:Transmembrane protein n=1 Tax=Glossina pallidipes TaxID=7398 RepID=A0A1A9ZY81_GLOPL